MLVAVLVVCAGCGQPSGSYSVNPTADGTANLYPDQDPKNDPDYTPNPDFENFKTSDQRKDPEPYVPKNKPVADMPTYEDDESFTILDKAVEPPATSKPAAPKPAPPPPVKPPVVVAPPIATPPIATPPVVKKPEPKTSEKAKLVTPKVPAPVVTTPPPNTPPPTIISPGGIVRGGRIFPLKPCAEDSSFKSLPLDGQAWCHYASGQLFNATPIPKFGPGYTASESFRRVQFGTRDMFKVIEFAAKTFSAETGKDITVLTISKKEGGPIESSNPRRTSPAHASHDNGLDGDFYLITKNADDGQEIVNERTGTISNLDLSGTIKALRAFVSSKRIHTILVNKYIKKEICKELAPNDPLHVMLYPLEKGHTSHYHVRLICPEGSGDYCKPQPSLKKLSNCDSKILENL